jgi:signal transduction histidine kinase
MRWSLKTKEATVITLLILGVVVTTLLLHLSQLTRVVVEETQRQAELVAKQIVAQSASVLARAPRQEPLLALASDTELRNLLEASVGYSPHLLYAFIADTDLRVILHSQSGKIGEPAPSQRPLAELLSVNPLRRLDALLSRGRTYETSVAISLDRRPFGSVRLGFSSSFLRRELNEAVTQSLVLAGVALPAAWLVALFLANLWLRPIGQLARDLDRVRRGELNHPRSPVDFGPQEDELGELASQLQLLTQQLQADRLRVLSDEASARDLDSIRTLQSLISYSSKLAALGRLTSGVAHEVKNPLNAMMIHLELVKARLAAPRPDLPGVRESLDIIGAEIRRLDRVVNGFLKFVRSHELALKPVDLNALAQGVVALLEAEWKPARIRFALALDGGCPRISGDEELLRQALLNVVVNACQAMPAGGTVTLETRRPGREWVAVAVTDEGTGIAPEDRERIFSLYYTTKPEGSGIGLSLVYRIVQMHDGVIDVETPEGQQGGTRMTIRLPVR